MKAFQNDICKNPLKTRDDLAESLLQMLRPLSDRIIMDGSALHVGNTCATSGAQISLMEGWSRLLWGIVPFTVGGYNWNDFEKHANGFKVGPDPKSLYFWGDIKDYDQKIVEQAAMSLSIILAPEKYLDPLDSVQKQNLINWLSLTKTKKLPENNWFFFRVLVNIALEKCGLNYDSEQVKNDLDYIDTLYVGDGWYHDKGPFDMYNPFAIHFYSLLYCTLKEKEDKERCERYKARAGLFAKQFIHYFHENGSCVAFGRSLAYRFSVVSFFSACAYANLEVLPWGVMKGIVLRNLRWWFSKPIFDHTGILTCGYAYPSLFHVEKYIAPGSPYWSLKTYLVLALDKEHPFWQAEELPLPKLEKTFAMTSPKAIFYRTESDVVMLNSGQHCGADHNNVQAKYQKFAYSAKHAFSVAVANYGKEKVGFDSMLILSEGDGYWRERRDSFDEVISNNCVRSKWEPWKDVEITTWLIPCDNWHVRIHKIISNRELECLEGGFSLQASNEHEIIPHPIVQKINGQKGESIVLSYPWGISCILDCSKNRTASSLQNPPNTNLLHNLTVLPYLEGKISKGETTFACLVSAGSRPILDTVPEVRFSFDEKICYINGKKVVLI